MKRPRFSLVTLIVAVNLFGAVIAANLFYKQRIWIKLDYVLARPAPHIPYRACGWPLPWHSGISPELEKPSDPSTVPVLYLSIEEVERSGLIVIPHSKMTLPGIVFYRPGLLWDMVIGIALVCIAAALTEWLVRRRRKARET